MNSIHKILCNMRKKHQIFKKYFTISRKIYVYTLVNIKFKI